MNYGDMKPEYEQGASGWFTESQLLSASLGRIPLGDTVRADYGLVDYIFYTHDADEFIIEFFVAKCVSAGVDGPLYDKVFTGSGPSGNLRELGLTHWGESGNSGYIFYPNPTLIALAFKALERRFDL